MDKNYWNTYYRKHGRDKDISMHSSFALFCMSHFFNLRTLNIVELGSGNGRDAIFFARNGHKVHAIDQSNTATEIARRQMGNGFGDNLIELELDFVAETYSKFHKVDVFYSRFTLHIIKQEEEDRLLPRIYDKLEAGGLLCIEARTTKDPLFGQGMRQGKDAYVTDHYRRFIHPSTFLRSVLSLGFKLRFFTEENNLSVYKDDNPVLMRIILEK